ncbi:MAG: hypothetical protein JO276_05465 [Sphingomonadaceae bacterium]|nr:hypothetical protein [Sphingomonadaceae bacterium]
MDLTIWTMTICRVRPRRGNDRNQPASIRERDMPINREAHRAGAEEKSSDVGNREMVPDARLRDNVPPSTSYLAPDARRRRYRAIAALLFDFPPRRGFGNHAGPVDPQLPYRRTHAIPARRAFVVSPAGLPGQASDSIIGSRCSDRTNQQRR